MLAVLYAVSRLAPVMPAWALAFTWALLSLIPATGVAYHAVINKTFGQKRFKEGSRGAAFNNGRCIRFVLAYVLSAVCMGSILVSAPAWDAPIWITVVVAVPLYVGVSLAVGRFMKENVSSLFQESYTALWSAGITGVLLCVAFAVLMSVQPAESYACAADAFLAAPRPFDDSPSAIMSEAGDMAALVSGLASYARAKVAEASFGAYVVWQVVLNGAAFFGIASLLAVCSIRPRELKRVFLVLEGDAEKDSARPLLKRYVAVSVALPLVLVTGFLVADAKATDIVSSDEYTAAQKFIRDQVGLVVYEFDGKYYNPEAVNDLLAHAHEVSEQLAKEAEETLVPLINASFDARVANVDRYLDWYYSLFADWEQLFNVVTGTAEEFAAQQLEARIEEGIDDSELNEKLAEYLGRAEDLRSQTMAELSRYEIVGEYPDWLLSETGVIEEQVFESVEPSQKLLEAHERIGISVTAGVIAGVIAKRLVKKIVAKAGFKAIASRVSGLAAVSTSAAVGGPVAVGVSIAASLAADVALQKADELLNRETYKEELVSAIEEQRQEMLSAVRASTSTAETTAPR